MLPTPHRVWSPTGRARGTGNPAPMGATSRPPIGCCTTVPPTAEGRGAMAGLAQALLLACGLLTLGALASAHGLSTSYTAMRLMPEALDVTFSFDLTDLVEHFAIDKDANQAIAPDELEAAVQVLFGYLEASARIAVDGSPVMPVRRHSALRTDAGGRELLDLTLQHPLSHRPRNVSIEWSVRFFETFGQQHTNLVSLAWRDRIEHAVVSLASPGCRFVLGRLKRSGVTAGN